MNLQNRSAQAWVNSGVVRYAYSHMERGRGGRKGGADNLCVCWLEREPCKVSNSSTCIPTCCLQFRLTVVRLVGVRRGRVSRWKLWRLWICPFGRWSPERHAEPHQLLARERWLVRHPWWGGKSLVERYGLGRKVKTPRRLPHLHSRRQLLQ